MTKFLFPFWLTLVSLTLRAQVDASASTLMVHGSGSTNPEKCFANIVEEFVSRSKLPIRMSYRSVGSSTGLAEFVNDHQFPIVDYASGEIPVPSEDWQQFKANNVTILHLPVLYGAVSFFHSSQVENLNLTSCVLAKIFTRKITDWSHEEILKENPNINLEALKAQNGNTDIQVARREDGSGNTLAIGEYLNKACPEHFPSEMVSSLPSWPVDTVSCRGNGGLLSCIQEVPGTIGYLEAGSGTNADLPEVSLKNKYGRTLNSKQAAAFNGIGVKENGVLPTDPSADFGQVSLMDQNGEFTWPITLATYIYVRQDLAFMKDPQERALLIAFLKALYDPTFVDVCAERYGFTLADGISLDLAQKAIGMLELALTPEAEPWIFEEKTRAVVGTGDYVISSNRLSLPQDERESNHQAFQELQEQHDILKAQVEALMATQAALAGATEDDEAEFTHSEQAKITAGLVMSAVGLGFALIALAIPMTRDDAKSG